MASPARRERRVDHLDALHGLQPFRFACRIEHHRRHIGRCRGDFDIGGYFYFSHLQAPSPGLNSFTTQVVIAR
jgi:hypothetical protein